MPCPVLAELDALLTACAGTANAQCGSHRWGCAGRRGRAGSGLRLKGGRWAPAQCMRLCSSCSYLQEPAATGFLAALALLLRGWGPCTSSAAGGVGILPVCLQPCCMPDEVLLQQHCGSPQCPLPEDAAGTSAFQGMLHLDTRFFALVQCAPPWPAACDLQTLMQARCGQAPSALGQARPRRGTARRHVTSCALHFHPPGNSMQPRCSMAPCSAGDNAIFAFPETRLGIIPGAGGTQRLPRVVGRTKAKELIFTGSRLDARRAYDIGEAAAHGGVVQGPDGGPQLIPTPAEQLPCTPSCSC